MARRRVLLVAPRFHGYWESVSRALDGLGFDVVPFVYDARGSVAGRVGHKLAVELPGRLGVGGPEARWRDRVTRRAEEALAGARPDAVLAMRSDVLDDRFWRAVDDRRIPRTLWLYDELARVPHPHDRLVGFTEVVTYSRRDRDALAQRGVPARYLPNAFDPAVLPTPVPTPVAARVGGGAVVFVGARYPGRERTLVDLGRAGVAVHAVGRDWSHHPVDRLRTWQLRRPAVPSSRDVARAEAYALMAAAPATLNLHEGQDGFTMRTFEASGVGALQLIDRTDVDDLYEPGEEIVPFGSPEELVELCRRATADGAWRRRVGEAARARTLREHTFTHRLAEVVTRW